MKLYFFIIVIFLNCSSKVQIGLDQLLSDNLEILSNKNIGLIINQTSISSNNEHIVEILLSYNLLNIVKIFAPEHGYKGNYSAGENIEDGIDPYTGIKIVSLYGSNSKKPNLDSLSDIDILIYDIQDIGSRYYTFISSLYYMMEIASEKGIPFIVLDRPNPLGRKVSGPLLDKDFSSFVGLFPIPIRHGMTTGELALMINNSWMKSNKKCDLKIIEVKNWNKNQGYFTIPTSPNIPNFKTALAYSGMCLLEGTNISEGRGTDNPFLYFGAPWIDSKILTKKLNGLQLKGVTFKPVEFIPLVSKRAKWPKYKNKICYGCELVIEDNLNFEPIDVAVRIIKSISELHSENFKFLKSNFIDKLYGSNRLRKAIEDNKNIDNLIENWLIESQEFIRFREPFLIY